MVTTTKIGKAHRLRKIKKKQAKELARVTGISRKEALKSIQEREFVAKTDELSLYEAQFREEEVTTPDSSSQYSDKGFVTSSKTAASPSTTQQPTVADKDARSTASVNAVIGGSSANHLAGSEETDDPEMSGEGPNDEAAIDPELSSEAEDGEESENTEDADDDVEYHIGSDGQEYYTGPDGLPVPKAWGKVTSCYKTFLNPAELIDDDIMILNFPNRGRHQPYNEESGQKPLEFRLKRKAGLMEIDVPIVTHKNYDKDKGELYAEAIRQSAVLREGGSYGMAGGFGVGGGGGGGRSRPVENEDADADEDELGSDDEGEEIEDDAGEEEEDEEMPDVDAPETRGPILDRITLGGRIERPKPYDPHYFIGTFRGGKCIEYLPAHSKLIAVVDELHLTRVHAFVTLRPTLSHLDAMDELHRRQLRSIREDYDQPEPGARAVNMTAQSADEEEMDMSDVSKSLRAIQEEPWVVGSWVDENVS